MITNDPTVDCTSGDILRGANNKNIKGAGLPHFIIYLGPRPNSEHEFLGAMLTTSDKQPENIPMKPEHFKEKDKDGNPYSVTYKNSKVVAKLYVKKMDWRPFELKGQLTEEGLTFVTKLTDGMNPEYYHGNL